MTAVAISTTGHAHRMPLLAQCVEAWDAALDGGDSLFVTVDGTEADAALVAEVVAPWTGSVYRVGGVGLGIPDRARFDENGRQGVATSKNTGLELMMYQTRHDRLWLSDDDSWPLSPASLVAHYNLDIPHSLVCWGQHRLATESDYLADKYVRWTWPRGAIMYVTRYVLDYVGGMIEDFGHGGHEHVEWSKRIHARGLTPAPFLSPALYADDRGMGARVLWHCEDMSRPGEPLAGLMSRRRHLTTIRRSEADQRKQDAIMARVEGSTAFVPYKASWNGRVPATLTPSV